MPLSMHALAMVGMCVWTRCTVDYRTDVDECGFGGVITLSNTLHNSLHRFNTLMTQLGEGVGAVNTEKATVERHLTHLTPDLSPLFGAQDLRGIAVASRMVVLSEGFAAECHY